MWTGDSGARITGIMTWTAYEFFAGGGLARLGLGSGWTVTFANDIDPAKARAYAANHGERGLIVGDVGDLTPAQLPGQADLAWASFPCHDLSLAGAGAGLEGERSGTFLPFWMLMLKLRALGRAPRVIVLENVCGLLTSNEGADFRELCRMIHLGGYHFGALIMDAKDFLPQSRPRLFIVACDRDYVSDAIATGPDQHWHPTRLRTAVAKLAPDLRDAWLWLTPPLVASQTQALSDLVEDRLPDADWHTPAQTQRLLSMMTALNLAKVNEAARTSHAVGMVYRRTRSSGEGRAATCRGPL